MERPPRAFSNQNLERFARIFARHHVEYLIIGKSGAIVYGFPDTTQDLDIKSKRIASREKDKEVLERLEAFAKYLKGKRPKS